jgi:hypothetical protein
MKRFLSLLLLLPACWGDGPTPTFPAGVTIVFHVARKETACNELASYIGDVEIGKDVGYATVLPYTPPQNCDNMNGNNQMVPVPVFKFDTKTVKAPEMLDTPTTAMNGHDPVALGAHDSKGVWAYMGASNPGPPPIVLAGDVTAMLSPGTTTGTATPAAIVLDNDYAFVIGRDMYNSPVSNPQYPCCSTGNNTGPTNINAWRVSGSTGTSLPMLTGEPFYVETLATPLVQNTQSLFYTSRATDPVGSPIKIKKVAKDPVTSAPVELDSLVGLVPVGLAADDNHVVAAESTFSRISPPSPRCVIVRYPEGGMKETLLNTDAFACQSVSIDSTHAYFAIVSVASSGDQPAGMVGVGIGRVTLTAPHTIETLDVGTRLQSTGPRRVIVEGDDIFAIDAFNVVKLPKPALASANDFPP